MEWEKILYELIEYVKEASPQLWAIGIKQVTVIGVQQGIGAFFCFLFSIAGFIKARRWIKRGFAEEEDEFYGSVGIIAYVIAFVLCGIGFLCIGTMVSRFINPEYYAIKYLLNLARY